MERDYLPIGRLDDREITSSLGKRLLMILSPFVYLYTGRETPMPELQAQEVASAHWVPLSYREIDSHMDLDIFDESDLSQCKYPMCDGEMFQSIWAHASLLATHFCATCLDFWSAKCTLGILLSSSVTELISGEQMHTVAERAHCCLGQKPAPRPGISA